jgi:hypothetical protein
MPTLANTVERSIFDGRNIMKFEGLNALTSRWSFRVLGKRCPNKGEFFMSGAIPEAYKARQHLTQEYYIVEPIEEYSLRQVWLPKSRIKRAVETASEGATR